jgi:exopolysaccharide biosynthesis protein
VTMRIRPPVAAFNLTVSTVIVFVMSQILLPRVKGVKYIVPKSKY